MRINELYIEKVNDDVNVYLKHLRTGVDLEPRFQEAFEKIEIARAWLRDGYSDTEVLNFLRNDSATNLSTTRAREVLNLAYEIFADTRIKRNQDGVKQKYADEFNEKAKRVLSLIENTYENKEKADLYKIWQSLKKQAAEIDGAYLPTAPGTGNMKKPTKIKLTRISEKKQDGSETITESIENND